MNFFHFQSGFRISQKVRSAAEADDAWGCDPMVPCPRTTPSRQDSDDSNWHVVGGLHFRRTPSAQTAFPWSFRNPSATNYNWHAWDTYSAYLARISQFASLTKYYAKSPTLQQYQGQVSIIECEWCTTDELSSHVRPQETCHGRRVSPKFVFQGTATW